jgi:Icc-related predicted phosphoesterase
VKSITRIFFATDIHGSEVCFRKFLNLGGRADVLIMGGDISGKHVVPIVEDAHSYYTVPDFGDLRLETEEDKVDFEQRLADKGIYPYVCSADQFKQFSFDGQYKKDIHRDLAIRRLKSWVELANARLKGSKTKVVMNCGNDDPEYLDQVLDNGTPAVVHAEGRVLPINDDLQLLSTGYTTETPWCTEREDDDDVFHGRLCTLLRSVSKYDNCIFNFHCPPKDTRLDLAPKLTQDKRPIVGVNGQLEVHHVGCKSVRDAIEKYKPVASLHGHIHESRGIDHIGRTVCINPGSVYSTGSLLGAWLTFRGADLIGARLTQERLDEEAAKRSTRVLSALFKAIPFVGHSLEAVAKEQDNVERSTRFDRLEGEITAMASKDSAHPPGNETVQKSEGGLSQ